MNNKKRKKAKNAVNDDRYYYIAVISLVLLLSVFVLICYFIKQRKTVVSFELLGEKNVVLSLNQQYEESGVSLKENDVDLELSDIKITSNYKNEVGEYEIDYEVKYDDQSYKLTRNVSVIDNIAPEFIINNKYVYSNVCKRETKKTLNFEAIDNYDGVLTEKVNVEELEDKYVLSVEDSFNNRNTFDLYKTDDISNNVILTLNGKLYNYVSLGTEFEDLGVEVTDVCGNKLDTLVNVDSNLDINIPGTYKIKYYVNENISVTRIVVVYNKFNKEVVTNDKDKVIYLTFDDGPGAYTEQLLDILKKYDVKATFFVTNQFKKYVPLIKRESDEGHIVAVHTATHNWNIYRSFENYYKDFKTMDDIIYDLTNKRSDIFRFPGGGSNTVSKSKASKIMSYNSSKMMELGYQYFDWNVDSEDAAGANSDRIYRNVTNGIASRNYSVVLMHDIKEPTINAIEKIIKYALDNGYTFDTLSNNSPTVHHHVNN